MAHRVIDFYTGKEVEPSKISSSPDLNQWNEFDSAEEALEMIANKKSGSIVLGNILHEIEKTWKPLEIRCVRIPSNFVWNDNVYFLFGRYCYFVGTFL